MALARTFRGGVHPPESKELTQHLPLKPAPAPELVYILLQQHIGAPCEALVKKGDRVFWGQKVGDTDAFVSAPVHSSVSGTVKGIETVVNPQGQRASAVVIENDGEDEPHPDLSPAGADLESMTPEDIKGIVREAGIVGMGGAAFPTHVKMSPPEGKVLDMVILNGCECEPYLTCDHRLMLEFAEEIVFGLKAVMKGCGVAKGLVGIEDNKPDAAEAMREAADGDPSIEVHLVHTKYPQGAEKQLIQALTGREVPSGGLPLDIGIVVQNVATARAVARAIRHGHPLVDRPLSVTGGGVKNPVNLFARVGTPLEFLIEQAGGPTEELRRIVLGGPMMGTSVFTTEIPVAKGTSGILLLGSEETSLWPEKPCIRCGQCVSACPVGLMPLYLGDFPDESALQYRPLDCIECGCCTYVCPSRRMLMHSIRLAKAEAMARDRD